LVQVVVVVVVVVVVPPEVVVVVVVVVVHPAASATEVLEATSARASAVPIPSLASFFIRPPGVKGEMMAELHLTYNHQKSRGQDFYS
jgi:hypothetical protein